MTAESHVRNPVTKIYVPLRTYSLKDGVNELEKKLKFVKLRNESYRQQIPLEIRIFI